MRSAVLNEGQIAPPALGVYGAAGTGRRRGPARGRQPPGGGGRPSGPRGTTRLRSGEAGARPIARAAKRYTIYGRDLSRTASFGTGRRNYNAITSGPPHGSTRWAAIGATPH